MSVKSIQWSKYFYNKIVKKEKKHLKLIWKIRKCELMSLITIKELVSLMTLFRSKRIIFGWFWSRQTIEVLKYELFLWYFGSPNGVNQITKGIFQPIIPLTCRLIFAEISLFNFWRVGACGIRWSHKSLWYIFLFLWLLEAAGQRSWMMNYSSGTFVHPMRWTKVPEE